jgi:hypothetical protein
MSCVCFRPPRLRRAEMHPAANEESASPAYAPPSGDLPSHRAQTGKGQRYLFVPTTLAGKRASEATARTASPQRADGCSGGERYEHDPVGAVRNSRAPPAHPTYSGLARVTIDEFAEAALCGISSRATHICFRSRPKRFIDEAVLCRLSPCGTSTWRAKRNAYDAFG